MFEKVLLEEGEGVYSQEEYNMRLQVLVELLRNRGTELQQSGKGLFSSDESSPEKSSRPSTVSGSLAADGARRDRGD